MVEIQNVFTMQDFESPEPVGLAADLGDSEETMFSPREKPITEVMTLAGPEGLSGTTLAFVALAAGMFFLTTHGTGPRQRALNDGSVALAGADFGDAREDGRTRSAQRRRKATPRMALGLGGGKRSLTVYVRADNK